jgi:putative lipoic acid-binding regulatory protein
MLKKQLDFPATYDIKIIMTNSEKSDHKKLISDLFEDLEITYSEISVKPSKNNKYNSYTYKVSVSTKKVFDALYANLAKMPDLKMAI